VRKDATHQDYDMMNLNLALLALFIYPHLIVVDGFVRMRGSGLVFGRSVSLRIALVGTDALAVDCFTTHWMGFKSNHISDRNYCAQLGLSCSNVDEHEILGNVTSQAVVCTFTHHLRDRKQPQWHYPEAKDPLRTYLTRSKQGGGFSHALETR